MRFGKLQARTAVVGLLLGVLVAQVAWAKFQEVAVADLRPTKDMRQTAVIITKVIDRFHYRRLPLDDAMSGRILTRYLESLDSNKSFFSRKDVQGFNAAYKTKLDDGLKAGNLEAAYKIFKVFRERVDERIAYALDTLKRPFNLTASERYEFDREKADWVADTAALDDLWRKRVKNDVLSLRLAGKKDDQIRETLTKRYEGIARRTHQFTSDDVFQTFTNAYTLTLEPHTGYMSPRTSENFDISMRLSLEGIGAVLRSENEHTVVQRTVPGGPAAQSGQIRAGDKIVGVAQGEAGEMQDVVGWRLQDVVDQIRGAKGSVVRLQVLPKSAAGDGPAKEVSLVRNEINLEDQAAKSEIYDKLDGLEGMRVAVIRVPAFYRDFRGQAVGEKEFRSTTRDVRRLLIELQKAGVDGIVVDLRHNGGGSLSEATELTGLFIGKGPVVQIKDSGGRIEVEESPEEAPVYSGPLAVLVDRDSASASEIFAGAIQDYRRGIVLGEPTFGKGTVQTLVDLGRFVEGDQDLGRLRLTMAQFFRVSGGSTQHRGVVPDIVFPTAKSASEHGERAFDNALPWASIPAARFRPVSSDGVASLVDAHLARVAADPGFRYLAQREKELEAIRDQKTVSLLESERRKEFDSRRKAQLDARNAFRKARGLSPLTQAQADERDEIESEEEDEEGVARILAEESARILADSVRLSRTVRAAQAY